MRARHFLDTCVEDDEIADQVEQAGLLAHLGQGPVQESTWCQRSGTHRLPFDKEFLPRSDSTVAQPLRIVPCEHQLDRREEALVENFLLVRDELAHAIRDLHGTPLQLDDADGNTVQVQHEVGAPLVTAAQGHFLREGEVVLLRVLPIHQID